MAFCSECGTKLNNNAKFCHMCGKACETNDSHKISDAYSKERRQEYVGSVRKCPSCGAEVPSFIAVCSSCGHEFNSQNVESHFKKFKDKIAYYDELIAEGNEQRSKGWKAWTKQTKIVWIILNLLTSFIPLIIYLTFPLIRTLVMPKSDAALNSSEQAKASFIKNYVFPNEREATYEAVLFTKSNLAFLSNEKLNNKTLYWINLWIIKAEQLKEKAKIILKGDNVIDTAFSDIALYKKNSQRVIIRRAVVGIIIIIGYSTLIIANGSLWNIASKLLFHKEVSLGKDSQWLETGLSCELPKIEGKEVSVYTNSDTELWIVVEDYSYSQFEKYIEKCKKKGYTENAIKDTHTYKAYNKNKDLIELSCYTDNMDIRLTLAEKLIDEDFVWPQGKLGAKLPQREGVFGIIDINRSDYLKVVLQEIGESDFELYINECKEKGFVIDEESGKYTYSAYDTEGYKLKLSYDDVRTLTITVEAPLEMTEYKWPESKIAKSLPEPKSNYGYISTNWEDTFTIYVGNTTVEDFNKYVDECLDKGYDVDYSRYDRSFYGENKKGNNLHIEYQGYNTMYIHIYNWN